MRESKAIYLFIIHRLLQAIPLVIIIIIISFFLLHISGDPILALAGDYPLAETTIEHLRKVYGLDKTLPEQLLLYFKKMVQGDLGFSYRQGLPVTSIIIDRLPATILLGAAAMLMSSVFGIALGIIASFRPRSVLDNIIVFLSVAGFSIPNFWFAQITIIIFSVYLGWLPGLGMQSITFEVDQSWWYLIIDRGKYLILPALVLSTSAMAVVARTTRTKMLEVMNMDFITTARAKGLPERLVLTRHVFRNSLMVVVTMIGLNAHVFIFGAVLVETVFAWPGVGRLLYTSILGRDYPVVLGIFIFATMLILIINLITDILYSYLDPRVRY